MGNDSTRAAFIYLHFPDICRLAQTVLYPMARLEDLVATNITSQSNASCANVDDYYHWNNTGTLRRLKLG